MRQIITILIVYHLSATSVAAPVHTTSATPTTPDTISSENEYPRPKSNDQRQGKNLNYFDYIQPDAFSTYDIVNDDDYVMSIDDNDLSRTIPTRKRIRPQFNSPIYYVRLPPQPYMFVPGLGYVSHPTQPGAMSQFVNLPVSFVANGKPNQIYQWSGGITGFPTEEPLPPPPPPAVIRPQKVPIKKPMVDSNIHRLPGQYTFNGKPEDIFVLRDSYNSLYGDALQNFYP